ncbi:Cyc3 [Kluyveromyces lactis]|nr:Cyc3 [Kluyveromyces lactis]
MGWFWADKLNTASTNATPISGDISACPVMHDKPKGSDVSTCPVLHDKKTTDKPTGTEGGCPVLSDQGNHGLNPLNNIPIALTDVKQSGQKLDLPTERTVSSIPKGKTADDEFWEYPSPQQMYNAMVRKGKIDPFTGEEIPEDAVESMVFVHNFLNEGCWQEILDWEKKYTDKTHTYPKLLQFMGKPDQLSPRARCFNIFGTLFPGYFSSELPFDRHDWIVLRPDPTSSDTENPGYRKVRYVIDFYGGPDDEEGLPTFNLDVRPALDNFGNAKDRLERWMAPTLEKYFNEKDQK